jgi:hypothetical protein
MTGFHEDRKENPCSTIGNFHYGIMELPLETWGITVTAHLTSHVTLFTHQDEEALYP